MKKNILVITGSPRKNGNSEMLAEAFTRGAEKAGHIVNRYDAALENVTGCRACDNCWSKGTPCAFPGSFNEKYAPLLEKADTVVLCTPLYFDGITSSLQAVLERTNAYLIPQSPKKLKFSEIALLVCGAEEGLEAYQGVIDIYKLICQGLQCSDKGMVIATGVYEKGEIASTDYLNQAELLGERV